MPIDPRIPLGVQAPQIDDPFVKMATFAQQRQQADAAQQQQRIGAQTEQMNTLKIGEAQQEQTDRSSVDAAFAAGADRDTILKNLPGHLRPVVMKQFQEADEAVARAQKLKIDAAKAKADADDAEADYFGALASGVKAHGYDPGAAVIALAHAKAKGYPEAEQLLQQIQSAPDQLPEIVNSLIASSKTYSALDRQGAAQAETERHNKSAEAATTAAAQATAANTAADNARQAAAQAEAARHNRATEAAAAASNADTDLALTPEALKLTARQYAMTGQLPPMGMGKQGAAKRTQIINEAAKIYDGLDLPSQVAAYKANQDSLKKIQGQRDAMGAFEETAAKNLTVFLDAAGKITDTGSPLLNQPLRTFSESVLGKPEMTAYQTARRTVIPEFAKILANPGLSGQLSDTARQEVEQVIGGNATLAQTIAAAKILTIDVKNRTEAYDQQIKAIQDRLSRPPGGTAPAAPAAAAPLHKVGEVVTDPSGKQFVVTAVSPDGTKIQTRPK